MISYLTVHGGWSDWTSWTECPVTCGKKEGQQSRNRTCDNPMPEWGGDMCPGDAEEVQYCNDFCCPGWFVCEVFNGKPKAKHYIMTQHTSTQFTKRKRKSLRTKHTRYKVLESRTISSLFLNRINLSLVLRKPVFGVSDQVRHKPGCTATEDS